jgi:hypothetical protein
MLALELGQDHLLDFEGDDGGRVFAGKQARHFHDQAKGRQVAVARQQVVDKPQRGHAAGVQFLDQPVAVHFHARLQAAVGSGGLGLAHQLPVNRRSAKAGGRPAARILSAATWAS